MNNPTKMISHCTCLCLVLSINLYLSFLFNYGVYHYRERALVAESIFGSDHSPRRLIYLLIEDPGWRQLGKTSCGILSFLLLCSQNDNQWRTLLRKTEGTHLTYSTVPCSPSNALDQVSSSSTNIFVQSPV